MTAIKSISFVAGWIITASIGLWLYMGLLSQ